jgi:uncharacterized protein (TIGR00290 family)
VRALLAWSGGKDSAWALQVLRTRGIDVVGLFTTVHAESGRVPIHEVRTSLLEQQADAVGLPLSQIALPRDCPNAVYERALHDFTARAKAGGGTHLAFGDLFLEEIRRYRERQFAHSGLELLFPLWALPTRPLAEEMTRSGLRAWITSVDTTQAPASWAGCLFDEHFVQQVHAPIDPCGENGEFHTFVFAGPMLRHAVPTKPGARSHDARWAYADLEPLAGEDAPD